MTFLTRVLQGGFLCLLSAFPGALALAQFSYDGNRWYEVEVTIFGQTPSPTVFPEVTDGTDLTLSYPPNTRALASVTDLLRVEEEPVQQPAQEFDFSDQPEVQPERRPDYGPPNAPDGNAVLLPDTARAAYTLLGPEAAKFTRHNSRLQSAAGHRVLFHGVWRQPMMNVNQSTPVAITGGDFFSPHHELEGFLRFSFNVNRIDVNADLWLMTFSPDNNRFGRQPATTTMINVPLSPARSPDSPGISSSAGGYHVEQVWRLKETRAMISGNLHYLDHPQLGMLVEVRPYELPVADSDQDSDF